MKWKSLDAVEVISPKKKKGYIGKACKYKNCLVIDLHKDGAYQGRYAMNLDTGEYAFKNDRGIIFRRKFSSCVKGDYMFRWDGKKDFKWDTSEDKQTEKESVGTESFERGICNKEEEWTRSKRKRSMELKYERINELMDRVPPEPEDLEEWILERYGLVFFFLDGTKKNSKCPVCGEEFPRKDLEKVNGEGKAKHNDSVLCPACAVEGTLKVRSKYREQGERVLVLQKINEKLSVARYFQVTIYNKYGSRWCLAEELVRTMMYKPGGYKIYYDQGGEYDNWYTGLTTPQWLDTNAMNRRMRICGLYPEGIAEALDGTDYESLTRAFETMARKEIEVDYNAAMAVGSRRKGLGSTLEYLLKGGFTQLLQDTVEKCWTSNMTYTGRLDLDGKTIEEVFQIKDRQAINRIRQMDGGEYTLEWLQYAEIKGQRISQDTLQWLIRYHIDPADIDEVLELLQKNITVEKIRNYLERESKSYGGYILSTLEHWKDYLSMMEATGQKLDDELFYKPKDLKARHDALVVNRQKLEAVKRMNEDPERRELEAEEMRKKFPEAEEILKDVKEKYAYQGEEYIMRIPKDLVEIVEEGYALHHCGGSSDRYFNRICNRETYIGFCRKVGEENIPFYTIEFEPDGTIRQNRSYYDEEPDIDTIRGFLKEWQREVKKRLSRKDLEYARVSAQLREQNIQELKERNNQFVLQKLEEDFMAAG